ncbi:hypothetical protein CCUS01_15679 [Colletotrichum cuscutae]|uniref:Uncharacterized protein n=1 Tax=Colletotrichum cuscutae TaxID=1209917 RepID=A0AAI9VDN9_9PEZI|nr:hypothetical protein CCUS01_15679 [Colletotrichum cuscutae]
MPEPPRGCPSMDWSGIILCKRYPKERQVKGEKKGTVCSAR